MFNEKDFFDWVDKQVFPPPDVVNKELPAQYWRRITKGLLPEYLLQERTKVLEEALSKIPKERDVERYKRPIIEKIMQAKKDGNQNRRTQLNKTMSHNEIRDNWYNKAIQESKEVIEKML